MQRDTTPVIEVFADVWCTFAHVGLRAIDEHRRALGRTDVALVVRAWPLELVNGAPMDPAKVDEHVHELQEFAAPQLFANVDTEHFPTTTLPALALVARAYRTHLQVGERMAFAVREALFERGQNIADPAVLARLADDAGIGMPDDDDHQAVLRDWADGKARGVIGSPHFFCGPHQSFCPSLTITKADQGLTVHRNREQLQAFLQDAFAELA